MYEIKRFKVSKFLTFTNFTGRKLFKGIINEGFIVNKLNNIQGDNKKMFNFLHKSTRNKKFSIILRI